MYLFGFGSLINLNSAQKSFERRLTYDDLIPVTIKGYEKIWNSIEHIEFDCVEVDGVFLNLQKNINTSTNGVMIKITDDEFEIVKLREKNYSQITIDSKDVVGFDVDDKVVAFMTTNKDKIATSSSNNCYIPARYINILTSAFEFYDEDFVKEYKKCLENLPFGIKEGEYKFSDPLQNKLAKEGLSK